jgi:hypothetical protein
VTKAEGRVIHIKVDIRMTPPDEEVGHTDEAMALGLGIIKEALLLIKTAGEREGLKVDITQTTTVF